MRLVVWPLNESEAGVDLDLLEKCEVPLDLESGKIHQVSNIICPDQKSILQRVRHNMMPYLTQKRSKILKILC